MDSNTLRTSQTLLSISGICFDQNNFLKFRSVCSLSLVGDYIFDDNLKWSRNVGRLICLFHPLPPLNLDGLGGALNSTCLPSQFQYKVNKIEEPDEKGKAARIVQLVSLCAHGMKHELGKVLPLLHLLTPYYGLSNTQSTEDIARNKTQSLPFKSS